MSQFDYEKAARAISESNFATSDDIVCDRYEISLRTLQRWKSRAVTDKRLARLVAKRQAIILPDWKRDATKALRVGLDVLESQMDAARGQAKYIGETSKAVQALGELVVTNEILDDELETDLESEETAEAETGAARTEASSGP